MANANRGHWDKAFPKGDTWKETLGLKGQFGAVGATPAASDSAEGCLAQALPSPALGSSPGCYCARKPPAPADKSNTVVMILKISSSKPVDKFHLKKIDKRATGEPPAEDLFKIIVLIAHIVISL